MKKAIAVLAAMGAVAFAQDLKPAPKGESAPAVTERPLSETEVLKIQLAATKIQLLQEKYKLQEYQKEVDPISTDQMAVLKAACKSVGVSEDKIQTECGISTGLGSDGKPQTGADGKPVQARVWWNKPAPPEEKKK